MSPDGTKVLTAGKMVGDGVWTHADPALQGTWYSQGLEQSQNHPDFFWRPDSITESSTYRNPGVDPSKLYRYILQKQTPIR